MGATGNDGQAANPLFEAGVDLVVPGVESVGAWHVHQFHGRVPAGEISLDEALIHDKCAAPAGGEVLSDALIVLGGGFEDFFGTQEFLLREI